MAKENEYVSSAAETMFESSQDLSMRIFMEGVEEANRIRRGQEIRLEQAEAALQAKENIIQTQAKELQAQADEIARLKVLLAETAQNK